MNLQTLIQRSLGPFRKTRMERELQRDIQEHLEMAAEENRRRGMSEEEALAATRRSFGGLEPMKEEFRDQSGIPAFETFTREMRLAFRSLRRAPAFTLLAVLTLAVGIGVNTAIFSAVKALLLRPPGISDPGRVVVIRSKYEKLNLRDLVTSYSDFLDTAQRSDIFSAVAIAKRGDYSYTEGAYPQRVSGLRVSARWFEVFGARPAQGRLFVDQEDRPGRNSVAILSHSGWQRIFGGDPAMVGKTIHLDGRAYKVVGIMNPEFSIIDEMGGRLGHDVYVPLGMVDVPQQRYTETFLQVARLRPGVTVAQARAVMAVLTNAGYQLPGFGYRRENGWGLFLVPYADFLTGDMKIRLLILWGAAGLVLLIVCTNAAGLAMARTSARAREMAVRTALGGSPWHLIRHTYAESLAVALAGSLAGFGIAYAIVRAVKLWGPPSVVGGLAIPFDLVQIAFTLATGIGAALLVGIAPALQLRHGVATAALKDGGRSATPSRSRMRIRSLLVTAQVTLALMLSIGAGLLLRSLSHLQRVDTGFDPEHVATVSISLPQIRYQDEGAITGFFRSLLERLSATPGVQSVAYGYPIPFGEGFEGRKFDIIGRTQQPGEPAMQANTRLVTPEFFATLKIPLVRGRWFTSEDVEKSERVVVIDDALAARYWPGEDPLGQRIRQSGVDATIVGVVGHTRVSDLASVDEKGVFYQCFYQGPIAFGSLIVRTGGDPETFTGVIRAAVNSLDPQQPIYDAASMQHLIGVSLAGRCFTVVLLTAFAAAALFLAALGLYSVINYGVTQRTQEIGIRMALGASRTRILSLILGRGMGIALPGLALGWIAAYQAALLVPGQLFGVAAFDPATFAATALLLMVISLLACYVPARRATRLDPVESCRCE